MIVADTSALVAFFNRREPRHDDVRDAIGSEPDPLVVSPYVVAELDYLVATRVGVDVELEVLRDLGGGAYHLAQLGGEDLHAIAGCRRAVPRSADRSDRRVARRSRVALSDTIDPDPRSPPLRRRTSLEGGRFKLLP